MPQEPVPQHPGRDSDPSGGTAGPGDHPWLGSPDWTLVPQRPDWDEAWLAARAEDEDPGGPEEYEDPDNAPPPGLDDDQLAALIAGAREVTAEQVRAAEVAARLGHTAALAAAGAMSAGRRGPGMPGSAQTFPGEYVSRAAGFAAGKPLDLAPGCPVLAQFAGDAAGDDDRYGGASDDELLGVICAWDRAEANACAGKHAAVAELIRRRPAPGCAVEGPARMPAGVDEFTGRELGAVLGVSGREAGEMLYLAGYLEVNLPGTRAAFRAGILSRDKAAVIAAATALLDPAEARAAEAMVLGRAGSLTPGALRAAIGRAVMEVNPGKARKRREQMAKRTRVERWPEDSGNAGLAGRELPPAQVLAADQRVTAWAKQLRKAGLDGDLDQLRARAYLDILLGVDSRPLGSGPDSVHDPDGTGGTGRDNDGGTGRGGDGGTGPGGSGPDGSGPDGSGPGGSGPGGSGPDGCGPGEPRTPAPAGPLAGVIPPGFAGRVTLTIPAATLLGLAAPARGDGRPRPHRPRPGPRPGRRCRPQPPIHLVRHRHRPPRTRHRARLRPARSLRVRPHQTRQTQYTGRSRPAHRAEVHPDPYRPGRPAWRLRHLAVRHWGPRPAGPAPADRADPHRRMRPPAPGQGPRPRRHAPAPDPGPARHVHRAGLPETLRAMRFRAQRSV